MRRMVLEREKENKLKDMGMFMVIISRRLLIHMMMGCLTINSTWPMCHFNWVKTRKMNRTKLQQTRKITTN